MIIFLYQIALNIKADLAFGDGQMLHDRNVNDPNVVLKSMSLMEQMF